MKKKLLTLAVVLLLLPISTIAFAYAVPLGDKDNEKFQTYYDEGTYNAATAPVVRTYIPSFEQVNKMVGDLDETFINYKIVVDGKTYLLNKDFAYTGHATQTYFDPVFRTPAQTSVVSSRASMIMVTYMFDFSAFSGSIEGTLMMHAVFAQGNDKVHSLSGTGDLQNVQITALNLPPVVALPLVTVKHGGMVSGWPDIAPLP